MYKQALKYLNQIILVLIVTVLTYGCEPKETNPETSIQNAYPSPIIEESIVPQDPYPSPINENDSSTVKFRLNSIFEEDTKVTGLGPNGTPIEVVDITFNEVIGSGVITEENSFSIELARPIVATRVIGIRLSIPKDADTWLDLWELRGENARSIPNLGYFFDSVISQPLD
jgi:hypothetical protein